MPEIEFSKRDSTRLPERSELTVILALFLLLRFSVLSLYQPVGLLNAYTDYYFYYRSAQLTDMGYYPFINMWYEYPPLLAYTHILPYRLVRMVLPAGGIHSLTYQIYAQILGVILLLFEAGGLLLLHRIAARLWGVRHANRIAWMVALLGVPLFFWSYSHQAVPTFFMLLTVYWFIEGQPAASGAALGLGAAAKITPAIMILPVMRFLKRNLRSSFRFLFGAAAALASAYLPFVFLGGWRWIKASFEALSGTASYGTLWALLEGNWGPGSYGALSTRLELPPPAAQTSAPAQALFWLGTLVMAGFYISLWCKPVDEGDQRQFLWFSTLSIVLFHLWSKGWSPQWAVTLIPFMLLCFPTTKGLLMVLGLSALVFLEWPLANAFAWQPLYAGVIISRTLFFIYLSWLLWRRIKHSHADMLE